MKIWLALGIVAATLVAGVAWWMTRTEAGPASPQVAATRAAKPPEPVPEPAAERVARAEENVPLAQSRSEPAPAPARAAVPARPEPAAGDESDAAPVVRAEMPEGGGPDTTSEPAPPPAAEPLPEVAAAPEPADPEPEVVPIAANAPSSPAGGHPELAGETAEESVADSAPSAPAPETHALASAPAAPPAPAEPAPTAAAPAFEPESVAVAADPEPETLAQAEPSPVPVAGAQAAAVPETYAAAESEPVAAAPSAVPVVSTRHESIEEAMQSVAGAMAAEIGRDRVLAVTKLAQLSPGVRRNETGAMAAELLTTALVNRGETRVVEEAQVERILEETQLGGLGLTQTDNASKIGQMLGSDAVVVGSARDEGDDIIVRTELVDSGAPLPRKIYELRFPAPKAPEASAAELTERLVVRTKRDALFRSLVVPGWGQFYNGDVAKGIIALTLTGTFLGASLYEYNQFTLARDLYYDASSATESNAAWSRAETHKTGAFVFIGLTAAWWGIVATEAYVNGTDTRPAELRLTPTLGSRGEPGISLAWRW